jgi:hypothetical protein
MTEALPARVCQDIVDSRDYIAMVELSHHRYYRRHLVVFQQVGGLRGFIYRDFRRLGRSEPRPRQQERFEADPVPIFAVRTREVTTTIYERDEEIDR